jgi:single-stranded DNA-binding protein
VIAWGKRADFAQRLAKGSHVKLDDELRFRSYIGNDNIRRHVSEVYVGSICKLDRAARPAQALLPQLANINAAMPS